MYVALCFWYPFLSLSLMRNGSVEHLKGRALWPHSNPFTGCAGFWVSGQPVEHVAGHFLSSERKPESWFFLQINRKAAQSVALTFLEVWSFILSYRAILCNLYSFCSSCLRNNCSCVCLFICKSVISTS